MNPREISDWTTNVSWSSPLLPANSAPVVSSRARARRRRKARRANMLLLQQKYPALEPGPAPCDKSTPKQDQEPASYKYDLSCKTYHVRDKVATKQDNVLLQFTSSNTTQCDNTNQSADQDWDASDTESDSTGELILTPASTIVASRPGSLYDEPISRLDPCSSNPPRPPTKGKGSLCQPGSTTDGPPDNEHDLSKLDRPVVWRVLDDGELLTRMEKSGSGTLFRSIERANEQKFLPSELRRLLDERLASNNNALYAKQPVKSENKMIAAVTRFLRDVGSKLQDGGNKIDPFGSHLLLLLTEYEALNTIVEQTGNHHKYPLVGASWKDTVHKPMLELATLHTPTIAVYNARQFRVETAPDAKLMDYAMVLKPAKGGTLTDERLSRFRKQIGEALHHPNYAPLVEMPSSVFLETKPYQKPHEARVQLSVWVASWFRRISQLQISRKQRTRSSPVVPVLIVEGETWRLWFASDEDSQIEVWGPVSIGNTVDLTNAYRLLVVLRILTRWMSNDFLDWVDNCLKDAEI